MSKKTKPEAPEFSEEELIDLVRRKAQAYLRLPNVTSVGVGYKQADGVYTDKLTVQFTVQKKLSLETLEAESLQALPTKFEVRPGVWIETDVLQRSYQQHARMVEDFRSAAEALDFPKLRRSRQETLSPGLSISNFRGTAGTLGAIVFDRESGEPLVLSNWHVLAGPGSQNGDIIHQPGPLDDSRTDKTLSGRLLRSHLGLAGDCAVASIQGRKSESRILELDQIPLAVAKASLDDIVVKSGRTTGVTFGIVRRVGVTVKIDYEGSVGVPEIGGFEIGPYDKKLPSDGEVSMGGDSGSLWLLDHDGPANAGSTAVGLHFAGESDPAPEEEHAVACNIHSVLDKLQVSLVRPPNLPLPEADSTERKFTSLLRRVDALERQLLLPFSGRSRSFSPTRPERVFEPDDRQRASNKVYPYNTVCSLLVNHNGKESIGSGWLVHPRVILTCAHVLRNRVTGQLPSNVDIWAGRSNNSSLDASAGDLFNFEVHPNYSGKDFDEFDVGAILLSEPLLASNQIILLRPKSEAQLKSATLEIAGYPKFVRDERFDGEELFWAEGPVGEVFADRFEYAIDTSPGQSGSPVLYYEAVPGGTKCYAVGIHSDGPENGANSAVRIRPDIIDRVNRWITRVEAN